AWLRAAEIARNQINASPDGELLGYLAKYEVKGGEPIPALDHIEAALRNSPENATVHFQAAIVYTLLDRKDRAWEELAAAVERKYPIPDIQLAPELESLRGDERYLRLFDLVPAKP